MSTLTLARITTANNTANLYVGQFTTSYQCFMDILPQFNELDLQTTNASISMVGNNITSIVTNNSSGSGGSPLTALTSDSVFTYWSSVSAISVQTFLTSGTWTKPATGTFARIQCWGGGAGGASGANTGNSTIATTNLGGGGGAYSECTLLLSSLPATVSVTVGAGGVGNNTLGNTTTLFLGAGGGYTAFGAYINAYGGTGTGYGGNSAPGVYPQYSNSLIGLVNATTTTANMGSQFVLGGLPALTNVSSINTSVWGGGGSLAGATGTNSGNSIYGGGAGGMSFGNSTFNGCAGGLSVFSGNGGTSGAVGGQPTTGFFPSGGGGGGAPGTTVSAITSGANGANGQCIVSVW